jgi:DNA-binding SARP family transcriptional activator/TolB-like protein
MGGLVVEIDGKPSQVLGPQRKALALLALLAAHGAAGLPRDKAIAYLWPDTDAPRARNALAQLIHRIRRELGPTSIVSNGDLRLGDAIGSDVADFRNAVAAGELDRATDFYGGDFLDGFFLRGAGELERWTEHQRALLRAEFTRALDRLVAGTATTNPVAAVNWLRRRVELDPLDSSAALRYIDALAATGDREGAIRHASIHASVVRAELEMEPDARILRRAESLRAACASEPLRDVPTVPPLQVGDAGVITPSTGLAPRARWVQRHTLIRWLGIATVTAGAVLWINIHGHAAQRHPRARSLADLRRLAMAQTSSETTVVGFTTSPRVLVLPLDNETGDTANAALGRVAADWIIEGLTRTGLCDVVDVQTLTLGLRRSPRTADSSEASDVKGLAERTGANLVVAGRMYRRGDSVEVWSRIVDPKTGRGVRALPAVVAAINDRNTLLVALRSRTLGAVAEVLDRRVNELVSTADQPPTYEAYREYIDGLDSYIPEPWKRAGLTHFLRAAQLDTNFVLPLIWAAHANISAVPRDSGRARYDSLIAVLTMRRDRLSPLARIELEYLRADVRDDLAGRHAAASRASQLAPMSEWTMIAGSTAFRLRRYRETIETLHRLDPGRGWVHGWSSYTPFLARSHHLLGEHDAELADALPLLRTDSASYSLMGAVVILGNALSALGHTTDVNMVLDSAAVAWPARRVEGVFSDVIAEARVHGHGDLARQLTERCLAWLDHLDSATATSFRERLARVRSACLAEAGRFAEARRALAPDCGEPTNLYTWGCWWIEYGALSARVGDTAEVSRMRRLIAGIAAKRGELKAQPLVFEAHLAALRGESERAVDLLQRAIAFEGLGYAFHTSLDFSSLRGYQPFETLFNPSP